MVQVHRNAVFASTAAVAAVFRSQSAIAFSLSTTTGFQTRHLGSTAFLTGDSSRHSCFQLSNTIKNTHATSKCGRVGTTWRHMSSTAIIDESSAAETSQKNNYPNDNDYEAVVVAEADIISFLSSPNGQSGLMAIKLREGDAVMLPTSTETAVAGTDGEPTLETSSTGMFGGEAAAAAKKAADARAPRKTEGEDFTGKQVRFPDGKNGFIIAQRPPMAFVLCDFSEPIITNDDNKGEVTILSKRSSIKVGDHLIGNIIDFHGNLLWQQEGTAIPEPPSSSFVNRAILAPIPQVKDIALINSPLLSGTAMIDALAPIGKGQNMLVIGQDSGVGQRDLVITMLQTQVEEARKRDNSDGSGVKCVYALTSTDKSVREQVISQLKDAGILQDIVVVSARDHLDDDSSTHGEEVSNTFVTDAAEAIAVAATACSIGEAFALANGEDSLVIIDDIDQHKALWDWTTRVLVDFYGVDAVVKADREGGASSEMRAFYSSLIQRAARFNKGNGGGSMTLSLLANLPGKFGGDDAEVVFNADDFAESSEKVKQRIDILVKKNIPLTPETLRKIQIPVPASSESEKKRRLALQHMDDLISMSDGQIWLDETLYKNGQRPAMDSQRSITRVGIGADTKSRADAPALRNLAGGLRFEFAQANSLEGADIKSGADKQLLKKNAYLLAMHQESGDIRTLSENCVVLLAASLGSLNEAIGLGHMAGSEEGREVISGLVAHVWQSVPDTMKEIDSSLDLSPTARSLLEDTIKEHLPLE